MWFRKTIPFCQRTRTSPGCVAQQASGMGTLAIAFAARRTGEGEDACVHAFVRLVFFREGEVLTAPRPEAAALVLLDIVRLRYCAPPPRAPTWPELRFASMNRSPRFPQHFVEAEHVEDKSDLWAVLDLRTIASRMAVLPSPIEQEGLVPRHFLDSP